MPSPCWYLVCPPAAGGLELTDYLVWGLQQRNRNPHSIQLWLTSTAWPSIWKPFFYSLVISACPVAALGPLTLYLRVGDNASLAWCYLISLVPLVMGAVLSLFLWAKGHMNWLAGITNEMTWYEQHLSAYWSLEYAAWPICSFILVCLLLNYLLLFSHETLCVNSLVGYTVKNL